ncbi:MAG: maleylacetoacetate isomerase [Proteobacteria bacterium]|nr:maleylacetoacetate isomerase [Pseudomonadota bacterium]
MELFNYFRSSASWRVRIALALKGLDYDYRPVHLVRNEHQLPGYAGHALNALVPLLRLDEGQALHQSLAIIEYLDEAHPQPPLLPADALARGRVRAMALDVACEIHPLNNLRVLRYLTGPLGLDEAAKMRWIHHWIEDGLAVVERQIAAWGQGFCFGETPTLADCVLVPQVFNAQRFGCKLDHLPGVMAVHARCMALPAFARTAPDQCPDAE